MAIVVIAGPLYASTQTLIGPEFFAELDAGLEFQMQERGEVDRRIAAVGMSARKNSAPEVVISAGGPGLPLRIAIPDSAAAASGTSPGTATVQGRRPGKTDLRPQAHAGFVQSQASHAAVLDYYSIRNGYEREQDRIQPVLTRLPFALAPSHLPQTQTPANRGTGCSISNPSGTLS